MIRNAAASLSIVALVIGFPSPSWQRTPRIYGGTETSITNFPYQVSLREEGDHYCGAAIIDETHILTAAHCILPNMTKVTVHTGTSYADKPGEVHAIAGYKRHVHFDEEGRWSGINDIGIIELAESISFNERQQPVKLPTRDLIDGEKAVLTGWGIYNESRRTTNQLRNIEMKLIRPENCRGMSKAIFENQLCAFNSTRTGACDGDSGGPLVGVDGVLVGIASWVKRGECGNGNPDVYTNVYVFLGDIYAFVNRNVQLYG